MEEQVDHQAILVSGQGINQQLGFANAISGDEGGQAQAVVEALDQWSITDKIADQSFDSTASNTGIYGGACVHIEQKIWQYLLHYV